jgi:hypothetical protein
MHPFPPIQAAQYARALRAGLAKVQNQVLPDYSRRGVALDTFVGDFSWNIGVQEVGRSYHDFLAANVVLVCSKHVLVEDIHCNLVDKRMRNPGAWKMLARYFEGKQQEGRLPSCPALTSRSLSALTLAIATSLALASPLIGI